MYIWKIKYNKLLTFEIIDFLYNKPSKFGRTSLHLFIIIILYSFCMVLHVTYHIGNFQYSVLEMVWGQLLDVTCFV